MTIGAQAALLKSRARRALILARGGGTRMKAADDRVVLTTLQQAAAASGQKAFMPVGGRPLIEYLRDHLAAAGIEDLCLVVGPAQSSGGYSSVIQAEPRGTADAVLAARDWAGDRPFLVLNGDNLYPTAAIDAVAAANGPALAGFDRDDLVASSNISADRISAFAVLERDATGDLRRIVEKPSQDDVNALAAPILVSMNLWKFDARIFDACRDVPLSPRGEYELPSAVLLARDRGVIFEVVPSLGPVLDLSSRGDVADVERRLGVTR